MGDGESGGEEDEEEDGGPRTRNDHENALNGVPAYYAMPQSVLPVFFEPRADRGDDRGEAVVLEAARVGDDDDGREVMRRDTMRQHVA